MTAQNPRLFIDELRAVEQLPTELHAQVTKQLADLRADNLLLADVLAGKTTCVNEVKRLVNWNRAMLTEGRKACRGNEFELLAAKARDRFSGVMSLTTKPYGRHGTYLEDLTEPVESYWSEIKKLLVLFVILALLPIVVPVALGVIGLQGSIIVPTVVAACLAVYMSVLGLIFPIASFRDKRAVRVERARQLLSEAEKIDNALRGEK